MPDAGSEVGGRSRCFIKVRDKKILEARSRRNAKSNKTASFHQSSQHFVDGLVAPDMARTKKSNIGYKHEKSGTRKPQIVPRRQRIATLAKGENSSVSKSPSNMTAATALIKSGNKRLTPFQSRVLLALCQVPKGKVTTYKYLSDAIGCGSSQAVGQALKRNPYAPIVPCHRVIQSDLTMGGFGGTRAGEKIDKKIALLESERVMFCDNGHIDPTCIYKFDQSK